MRQGKYKHKQNDGYSFFGVKTQNIGKYIDDNAFQICASCRISVLPQRKTRMESTQMHDLHVYMRISWATGSCDIYYMVGLEV